MNCREVFGKIVEWFPIAFGFSTLKNIAHSKLETLVDPTIFSRLKEKQMNSCCSKSIWKKINATDLDGNEIGEIRYILGADNRCIKRTSVLLWFYKETFRPSSQ